MNMKFCNKIDRSIRETYYIIKSVNYKIPISRSWLFELFSLFAAEETRRKTMTDWIGRVWDEIKRMSSVCKPWWSPIAELL